MASYVTTRYSYSPKRRVTWEEIGAYLSRRYISAEDRVLELGCGYGDFIGNIAAKKRVAIEIDPEFEKYISAYPGVELHLGNVLEELPQLGSASCDVVLCSNFFEHFNMEQIEQMLAQIREVLSPSGKLIVVQPNFRLCAPRYFDDFTHKTVFSDVSFSDLLCVNGYDIVRSASRFLPFSFKSRLPISRLLVRSYLRSPFKPMGAQFLIVASTQCSQATS